MKTFFQKRINQFFNPKLPQRVIDNLDKVENMLGYRPWVKKKNPLLTSKFFSDEEVDKSLQESFKDDQAFYSYLEHALDSVKSCVNEEQHYLVDGIKRSVKIKKGISFYKESFKKTN